MPNTRSLASLTITDLHREIRARHRRVKVLEGKRAKVVKKLAALDAQIAAFGTLARRGGSALGGPGRHRNAQPLQDALAALLKGKPMSVIDAVDAVQKAGYRTTSPNFRTMVNAALLNKKRFKRVERGVYAAV